MIKPIAPKELFCHTYWKNKQTIKNLQDISRFNFTDASRDILNMDDYYLSSGKLKSVVQDCDLHQRLLSQPVKKSLTLYRGIPNPTHSDDKDFNYIKTIFNKCINLKKGDTLYMPEYSFWSDHKMEALQYANYKVSDAKQQGILYELEIPKDTPLYECIYIILKRCSKFICTSNKKIKKDNKAYNHIKLKLLPRDAEL